jgi:hypothetical protein
VPHRNLFRLPAQSSAEPTVALADPDRLAAERPELTGRARSLAPVVHAAFSELVPERLSPPEPLALLEGWRNGVAAFRVMSPRLSPGPSRRAGWRLSPRSATH